MSVTVPLPSLALSIVCKNRALRVGQYSSCRESRVPLPTSAIAEPTAPRHAHTARTATAGAPVAGRPVIVALSEDPSLLQALTLAVIEQVSVVTSPSVDRFVDQLVANASEVALIDAATAPSPLAEFILTIRRQFPQLVLVLAGSAQLQTELAGQIADGTIFRFVHKPASAQRLKLFMDAALRRGAIATRQTAAPDARHSPDAAEFRSSTTTTRPHWLWPLLWCLTTLGALTVGWIASGHAAHHYRLP